MSEELISGGSVATTTIPIPAVMNRARYMELVSISTSIVKGIEAAGVNGREEIAVVLDTIEDILEVQK